MGKVLRSSAGRRTLLAVVAVACGLAVLGVAVFSGGGEETATPRAAAAAGGCRVIEHALGSTCVPRSPQRVVVVSSGGRLVDNMLALGIKPVGSDGDSFEPRFPNWLRPQETAGIEYVGTISEPSLERIAALRPDVIVAYIPPEGPQYRQLGKIAPTVVVLPERDPDMRKDTAFLAEVLERRPQYQRWLERYEALVAEARGQLDAFDGKSVLTMVNYGDEGKVAVHGPEWVAGGLLNRDLGLEYPRGLPTSKYTLELGLEGIPRLRAADVLVVSDSYWNNDPKVLRASRAFWRKFTSSPLWQRLPAVRAGNVYMLPGYLMGGGPTPLWAERTIAHFLREATARPPR
jgi:iron complex transport system substrate-binding protein